MLVSELWSVQKNRVDLRECSLFPVEVISTSLDVKAESNPVLRAQRHNHTLTILANCLRLRHDILYSDRFTGIHQQITEHRTDGMVEQVSTIIALWRCYW